MTRLDSPGALPSAQGVLSLTSPSTPKGAIVRRRFLAQEGPSATFEPRKRQRVRLSGPKANTRASVYVRRLLASRTEEVRRLPVLTSENEVGPEKMGLDAALLFEILR